MLDDIALKKETKPMFWKKLHEGIQIAHFSSTNPASGFGPGQIYVKKFEAVEKKNEGITLFLLHDFCQYHGRFTHFIEWMKQNYPTLTIVAMDFVGHGLSSGTRGQFTKFDYLVKDFHNLLGLVEKGKQEKWIILGHGMGGLVGLDLVNRFEQSAGHRIDGMILSNFILKFQSIFLQMDEQIVGEKNILKKILAQTRPTRFFMGKDLLTDPLDVLIYEQDPLIIHRPTLNSVKELQRKTQTIYQDSYFIDRPLLLLKSEFGNALYSDGMDYFSKGIKKELLVEKKYSLMKHDLYNEREKEIVFQDILSWIKTYEA